MVRLAVGLSALALLSACAAGTPRASPASSSSNPSVVDGITIPPAYVTPAITVVPGPAECPAPFAADLSAAAGGVGYALTSQVSTSLATCSYRADQVPAGDCPQALILVNTEPHAYQAFDRWNVETGQNSMWGANPALRPTPILGIGIEAEWVPALNELGTGSSTTWVSVTLTCPGDAPNTPAVLALAEQLAKDGLASTA